MKKTKEKKILILNASPRLTNSSSNSIGEFLQEVFMQRECYTELIKLNTALTTESGISDFLGKVKTTSVIFLISPLYVDSLSEYAIRSMELLFESIGPKQENKKTTFIALSHSGLDSGKNQVSIKICENFARDMLYAFGGAFALGYSGPLINGNPLAALKRNTKHLQKALTIIAESIAVESPIPSEVPELMSKSMLNIPKFLLVIIFNYIMKICSKEKSLSKGVARLQSKFKLFC